MPNAGLAARWMSWSRRAAATPGPMAPAGETARTETIELLLGGQWVDITAYVYTRDKITITRGRADEARQTDPSTCHLTVNNISGRFSPRNPVGPYFGLIGRNTPIRVSVDQDGTRRYRFHGEVASWPQKWNLAATDAYVQIEAAGILRRLTQGASPLRSAMYRGIASAPLAPTLVAHWPCEDLAGSASIAAATAATRPMTVTGTPTFASSTTFDCSTPLPDIGTSRWTGTVPGYTNAATDPTNTLDGDSSQEVKFLLSVPTAGTTANAVLMSVLSTGSLRRYDIVYTSTGVHIQTYDSDDTLISDTVKNDVDGTPGYAGVQLIQGPFGQPNTTVNGSFAWYALGASSASAGGANAATQTCGRITTVIVNPNRSDLTGVVIGHITVHNIIQGAFVLSDQVQAFVGETAGARIQRLCGEEGIQFTAIGAPDAVPASATLANGHLPANDLLWALDDSASMGVQRSDTLVNLLRESADTDLGILYEPRDALGLGYRTRASLYGQSARLAMAYSNEEIGDALSPVDDDQSTRNDIVVSRPKGSSARATLTSGPLSVLPPPDGVGRYDDSPTANVASDGALPDQAGWRLHLGTVDEPRYPQITLNLENPAFAASQTLTNGAFMLEAGDRITVDMPSTWPLPDQISQIAQGFTETIGVSEHTIAVNCSPESPYRIGIADDSVLGRCDTAGSSLAVDVDATATTLSVATTSGPLWTTSGAEFPFDVSLGGEVVTVTNITGSSSPQAFVVTRSTNGVVKPQLTGADVRLTHPMILGL